MFLLDGLFAGWRTAPESGLWTLFIDGDVAVAGTGNFLIGGRATFDGDVYGRSNGTVLAIDHAVISGSIFHDQDALLDNCVNDALVASDYAPIRTALAAKDIAVRLSLALPKATRAKMRISGERTRLAC